MMGNDRNIISMIESFNDFDSLDSAFTAHDFACMSRSEFDFYLERRKLLFAKKLDLLCGGNLYEKKCI